MIGSISDVRTRSRGTDQRLRSLRGGGLRSRKAQTGGRVAFLDRDGTINVKAAEGEYITRAADVVLIPRAAEAIRCLNDAGVKVAVVTNQRGIARGLMTEDDLLDVHSRLRQLLHDAAGAALDIIVHCPHEAGECRCRKPQPGMLQAAAEALGPIAKPASVMVGDALSDVEAGRAFGVNSVLLGADADDLYAAVAHLLQMDESGQSPTALRV
jgi:D-glycero-D-manno-heptose 1,7-bisphosphate phosphatase